MVEKDTNEKVISRRELLESGVHFGHPKSMWNPKMKPYVFQVRKGVHILDLSKTISKLEEAYYLVMDIVKEDGKVLFVGTKKQARESIQKIAEDCDMPHLTRRWPGGFLTNWDQISSTLENLRKFEAGLLDEKMSKMTKRERGIYKTKIDRNKRVFGGALNLEKPPQCIFVSDVNHDRIAVLEAKKSGVPVIAILDSNSNPDHITIGIPGNDDAVGSISLLAGKISEAVKNGHASKKSLSEKTEEDSLESDEEG